MAAQRRSLDPTALTSREAEVVDLLRAGVDRPEIARRLGINPGTVSNTITRAKAKGAHVPVVPSRGGARPTPAERVGTGSVPPAPQLPDVPPHPFLTAERVAALLRCTSWADLAALAARWGKPMAAVQGWFQRYGGRMATVPRRHAPSGEEA